MMRRVDRLKDAEFAWNVFDKAPYVTIAMIDDEGKPYNVPVLASRDGNCIHVHVFPDGKMYHLILAQPEVCVCAVAFSVQIPLTNDLVFASAMMMGKAEIVEDDGEKLHAMRLFCQRHAPENLGSFDRRISYSIPHLGIVRITVNEITAKANIPEPCVVIK